MKKTFLFQVSKLRLIIGAIVLLSFAGSLDAQTLAFSDPLYVEPKGPFMAPAAAIQQLEIEAGAVKIELAELVQGTFAYKKMNAKYDLFNKVQFEIINGKTVALAIIDGLRAVSSDKYGISHDTLLEFREEIIDILEL